MPPRSLLRTAIEGIAKVLRGMPLPENFCNLRGVADMALRLSRSIVGEAEARAVSRVILEDG